MSAMSLHVCECKRREMEGKRGVDKESNKEREREREKERVRVKEKER